MNEAVEKFRAVVKKDLFLKLEDHQGKTTYENGVRDGLNLALAVVMDAPDGESEAESGT